MNSRLFQCLFVSVIINFNVAVCQNPTFPEINKPCPDFILKNVEYYSKSEVSLKDFKGKKIILDFWASYCLPCIESFPKTNELQKKFEGKMQFVLVGKEDANVRNIYDKMRTLKKLDLPVVYDSFLFRRFGITSMPFVIWIDESGIVKAITNANDVNEKNIQSFLDGRSFSFKNKSYNAQLDYDWRQPLLIYGNGGKDTNFLFRSILTSWDPSIPQTVPVFVSSTNKRNWSFVYKDRVQGTGLWLSYLYELAYGDTVLHLPDYRDTSSYGEYWIKPILEVKDSSAFEYDFKTGRGIYSYSLIVPKGKASAQFMQRTMQRDLEDYFGFAANIEKRKMPYWRLIVINQKAKNDLTTKGGNSVDKTTHFAIHYKNMPVKALIWQLWGHNQDSPPFVDETGIAGNIDIDFDANLMNFDEFKKGLNKCGLDLIKGEREMKVIVIRDTKKEK
jgi:thiol-disulfide isomerase/thioredoxin